MSALGWYLLGLFTPALVLGAAVVLWSLGTTLAQGWRRRRALRPPRFVQERPGFYRLNTAWVKEEQARRDRAAVDHLLKEL